MVYMLLSVAARPYQATETGASDFYSSCKIMGCAILKIIQICQWFSGFGRVHNNSKSDY